MADRNNASNVLAYYVDNFASSEASRVFDYVFDVMLKHIDYLTYTSTTPEVNQLINSGRLTMAKIRSFAKTHSVRRSDLIGCEVMTWSPVEALQYIHKNFSKNFYPESLLKDYFYDKDRLSKFLHYGKSDGSKICLADIISGECTELMCSTVDLREEFKKHSVSEWIDVIKEFGMKNHVYGYDTEFINAVNNLHKLSNSWDTLKYTQFTSPKAKAKELVPEDSNELFEIFGGNYNLIVNNKKFNAAQVEDNKDAEVLVVNKKLYDTYTPVQQRLVRAFLGSNMKELNSKIHEAVSVAYNKFTTFNNTPQEQFDTTMKRSMTGGFYTNTSAFENLNTTLKRAISKANFSSVLYGADFVIHQYIPMMKQAKKAGTFKNFNHSPFMNRSALCVIGGGSIMLNDVIDYEPQVKEAAVVAPSDVELMPVAQPEVIVREVVKEVVKEVPTAPVANAYSVPFINFTGGKKEETSAMKFVSELNKIQETFNIEFMKSYRKIIKFLEEVDEEEIKNDNITIPLFNSLDRIMIKNNKTATKLSGIKEEKSFNREYVKLVQATKERLSTSRVFKKLAPYFDALIAACNASYKAVEKARTTYLLSDKDRYDVMNIDTAKTYFDITREELTSIVDNFARITFIIQERGNKQIKSDSERVLKQYIETRKDKNRLIDEYFDYTNTQFAHVATKYPELKTAIDMRKIINEELRKSYKWLNNNLDVILVKQRLSQMKSKVLSKEVIDRIVKNKIQFNPTNNAEEIQKLVMKLDTEAIKPKYFMSYFKLYKLAKKIISAYGVLDFMELLYKELSIVGKDFAWGEFKHNFMNYIVSHMIGIDLFDLKEDGSYAYRSVGNNAAGDKDIKFDKDNATEFENIAASVGLKDKHTATFSETAVGTINAEQATKKKTEKLLQIMGQSQTQWVELADDYRAYAAGPPVVTEQFGKKSYFGGVVCIARQEKSKCTLGFSLRNFGNLRSYISSNFDMSDYVIKSLYLPVMQVFEKMMKQRGGETVDAFGNINTFMMGGDIDEEEKIDAGAIFDIIDATPENINDVKINPAATRFYVVMIAILKHYCKIFEKSELRVTKLSTLYKISALTSDGIPDAHNRLHINYNPTADELTLKQTIKVANEYFRHCSEKFDKALDLFISDLNSCLFFDPTGEDKETFMKVTPQTISDMFTKVIDSAEQIQTNELTTEFIDNYLNSIAEKMIKVTEEQRLGLLKEIIRGDYKDEKVDEYIAFCDTVLSPITICYQHYLNMLGKFVIDVCGLDASKADVPAELIRVFTQLQFYKDNEYRKSSSSLLLAYPEIYAENMTPKQVLDFLTTRYKDSMQKIIDVAIKYPSINDANVKELKNRLETQFIANVTAVADRMFGGFPVDGPFSVGIKSDMNHDKFIPTFEATSQFTKKFIHFCNDDTYGFNPDNYNLEEYFDTAADKHVSLTRYVCCTLANYTQNYYIPHSIVTALKETRLFGSVIGELQPINSKLNVRVPENKRPITELVSNADVLLSIMFHIARSRTAEESTSDVALSENVITHFCSVIPFMIAVLKQYKVVCKDYIYNLGETRIPVKEEAGELIKILTEYYNSIVKLAKHVEFGESLAGFDKNGYFTSFVVKEDGDETEFKQWSQRFCKLGLTPTVHEWINKYICGDLKYNDYDRFKSYDSEILRKINDNYFTNAFKDVIIPIMAEIHYKNLASHVASKSNNNDNRRLAGGAMTGGAVIGADFKATTKHYIDLIGLRETIGINDVAGGGADPYIDGINHNNKLEINVGLSSVEFIINAGIPLKNLTNVTDGNCLTGGRRDDPNGWFTKFTATGDVHTVLQHNDYKVRNSIKGNLPYFLCYQIPQTLLSYNKQYLNDVNIIINKFSSKIGTMTPKQKEHYNKIRAIIVDICKAINYTGYDGPLGAVAVRNQNILDHTYDKFVVSDFNNIAQVGMCIINVILAAYVIYNNCDLDLRGKAETDCDNYGAAPGHAPAEAAPNVKAANREKVVDFYHCWDVFQVFVNACFPDVTLDALSKVTSVTLDFWKIITEANLRVIGQYLFTTNDTHTWAFRNVADADVVGTSYSRTFKNVGAIHDNKKHISTAVDEKQRVFNAILTTDSKLHGPEDNSLNAVFDRVARIIDGLKDSRDKTSLQALTSAVLLLEDSIYESEVDGDNYKNFLRYGLNLHNENLLAAARHSTGGIGNDDENAVLALNTNGKKIIYNTGDDAHTKGKCPIANTILSDQISPAMTSRLMQLGFAFGDIVHNHDRSAKTWMNINRQLDNYDHSIFKTGYEAKKNEHYYLPIETTVGDKKVRITFESLIEDSPATLFNQSLTNFGDYIKQHGIVKHIYDLVSNNKDMYSVLCPNYMADVRDTDAHRTEFINQVKSGNLLMHPRLMVTKPTDGGNPNYYGTNIADIVTSTAIFNDIDFKILMNGAVSSADDNENIAHNVRVIPKLENLFKTNAAATDITSGFGALKQQYIYNQQDFEEDLMFATGMIQSLCRGTNAVKHDPILNDNIKKVAQILSKDQIAQHDARDDGAFAAEADGDTDIAAPGTSQAAGAALRKICSTGGGDTDAGGVAVMSLQKTVLIYNCYKYWLRNPGTAVGNIIADVVAVASTTGTTGAALNNQADYNNTFTHAIDGNDSPCKQYLNTIDYRFLKWFISCVAAGNNNHTRNLALAHTNTLNAAVEHGYVVTTDPDALSILNNDSEHKTNLAVVVADNRIVNVRCALTQLFARAYTMQMTDKSHINAITNIGLATYDNAIKNGITPLVNSYTLNKFKSTILNTIIIGSILRRSIDDEVFGFGYKPRDYKTYELTTQRGKSIRVKIPYITIETFNGPQKSTIKIPNYNLVVRANNGYKAYLRYIIENSKRHIHLTNRFMVKLRNDPAVVNKVLLDKLYETVMMIDNYQDFLQLFDFAVAEEKTMLADVLHINNQEEVLRQIPGVIRNNGADDNAIEVTYNGANGGKNIFTSRVDSLTNMFSTYGANEALILDKRHLYSYFYLRALGGIVETTDLNVYDYFRASPQQCKYLLTINHNGADVEIGNPTSGINNINMIMPFINTIPSYAINNQFAFKGSNYSQLNYTKYNNSYVGYDYYPTKEITNTLPYIHKLLASFINEDYDFGSYNIGEYVHMIRALTTIVNKATGANALVSQYKKQTALELSAANFYQLQEMRTTLNLRDAGDTTDGHSYLTATYNIINNQADGGVIAAAYYTLPFRHTLAVDTAANRLIKRSREINTLAIMPGMYNVDNIAYLLTTPQHEEDNADIKQFMSATYDKPFGKELLKSVINQGLKIYDALNPSINIENQPKTIRVMRELITKNEFSIENLYNTLIYNTLPRTFKNLSVATYNKYKQTIDMTPNDDDRKMKIHKFAILNELVGKQEDDIKYIIGQPVIEPSQYNSKLTNMLCLEAMGYDQHIKIGNVNTHSITCNDNISCGYHNFLNMSQDEVRTIVNSINAWRNSIDLEDTGKDNYYKYEIADLGISKQIIDRVFAWNKVLANIRPAGAVPVAGEIVDPLRWNSADNFNCVHVTQNDIGVVKDTPCRTEVNFKQLEGVFELMKRISTISFITSTKRTSKRQAEIKASPVMTAIRNIATAIGNVFTSVATPLRKPLSKKQGTFHEKAAAMFGGFSLTSGSGKDIVNEIYGDVKDTITEIYLNKLTAVENLEANILGFYKSSLMTLTPSFDRHMFMEILYNAKLYDRAVAQIEQTLEDPANNRLIQHGTIMGNAAMNIKAKWTGNYAANDNLYNVPRGGLNETVGLRVDVKDVAYRFDHFYKKIYGIDQHNALAYGLIAYLKNLEYHDDVFGTDHAYHIQKPELNLFA